MIQRRFTIGLAPRSEGALPTTRGIVQIGADFPEGRLRIEHREMVEQ